MNRVILMHDLCNFAYKVSKKNPMDIAMPMGNSSFACEMCRFMPLEPLQEGYGTIHVRAFRSLCVGYLRTCIRLSAMRSRMMLSACCRACARCASKSWCMTSSICLVCLAWLPQVSS